MRKCIEPGWAHSIYLYTLSFNIQSTLFISSHFMLWFFILNYFAGQAKLHNIHPNPSVKEQ